MAQAETKEPKPQLKRFKVIIHSQNGDSSDVVVGHNYVLNQYKRNVEVEMNEHYLDVLRSAVVKTMVQDENGVSKEISIPQHNLDVLGPA